MDNMEELHEIILYVLTFNVISGFTVKYIVKDVNIYRDKFRTSKGQVYHRLMDLLRDGYVGRMRCSRESANKGEIDWHYKYYLTKKGSRYVEKQSVR